MATRLSVLAEHPAAPAELLRAIATSRGSVDALDSVTARALLLNTVTPRDLADAVLATDTGALVAAGRVASSVGAAAREHLAHLLVTRTGDLAEAAWDSGVFDSFDAETARSLAAAAYTPGVRRLLLAQADAQAAREQRRAAEPLSGPWSDAALAALGSASDDDLSDLVENAKVHMEARRAAYVLLHERTLGSFVSHTLVQARLCAGAPTAFLTALARYDLPHALMFGALSDPHLPAHAVEALASQFDATYDETNPNAALAILIASHPNAPAPARIMGAEHLAAHLGYASQWRTFLPVIAALQAGDRDLAVRRMPSAALSDYSQSMGVHMQALAHDALAQGLPQATTPEAVTALVHLTPRWNGTLCELLDTAATVAA